MATAGAAAYTQEQINCLSEHELRRVAGLCNELGPGQRHKILTCWRVKSAFLNLAEGAGLLSVETILEVFKALEHELGIGNNRIAFLNQAAAVYALCVWIARVTGAGVPLIGLTNALFLIGRPDLLATYDVGAISTLVAGASDGSEGEEGKLKVRYDHNPE